MSKKQLFKRANLRFTNTTLLNIERRTGSSNLVYTVKDFKAMSLVERTKLKNVCIFKSVFILVVAACLTAVLFVGALSTNLSYGSSMNGPMLLVIGCLYLFMVIKLYFYATSSMWIIKNMQI